MCGVDVSMFVRSQPSLVVLSVAHPADLIKMESWLGCTPLTFSPPGQPLTPCTSLSVIVLSSWHASIRMGKEQGRGKRMMEARGVGHICC